MFSVGMAGKLRLLFNLHFSEQVSVMRISGRASVELTPLNVGIERAHVALVTWSVLLQIPFQIIRSVGCLTFHPISHLSVFVATAS